MNPRARAMPTRFRTVFAAGIRLDSQIARLDRLVHALGVAFDDHERHRLARELLGDDVPHAAEAADDEMLLEVVEHARAPAPDPPLLKVTFDQPSHQEGERVEHGRDPEDHDPDVEDAPGVRQRVHFHVADRRHRHDGHVERVEDRPALDDDVAGRAGPDHGDEQDDRQPPAGPPGRRTAGRPCVRPPLPPWRLHDITAGWTSAPARTRSP